MTFSIRSLQRTTGRLLALVALGLSMAFPAAGQVSPRPVPQDAVGAPGRTEASAHTPAAAQRVRKAPDAVVQPQAVRLGTTAAELLAAVDGQRAAVRSVSAGDPSVRKLDAPARLLLGVVERAGKQGANLQREADQAGLAVAEDAAGRLMVDLFIQLARPGAAAELDGLGVERRSQTGDIVVARAPVEALRALAGHSAVRFVEVSRRSWTTMRSSRTEIRADQVHQGAGLPWGYQGEGVVVGVIDSGIDFTHPDFSDERGTRIQYLLEFTQGGGQKEWTKAQIDANPAAVTERDGNGGHGHGTHVAGTAAGGGRHNPALRGIAPKADIIFVKGIREPESRGGFSQADVIAGTQYIFDKAAAMGKPAVVNLSLGSNLGALDGSSLYEQALSSLVGPGRIIVAAAGNEGFDVIHAGGTSAPGRPNLTIALPDRGNEAWVNLWYRPGVLKQVAVAALQENTEGELEIAASTGWVNVGESLEGTLQLGGVGIANVYLDAETTQDPQNGDGNVFIKLTGEAETMELGKFKWGILSQGDGTGRVDLWIGGGEFQRTMLGDPGLNEMPGNTEQTIGSPATAKRLLAVGSYVTSNTWTNIDGNRYEWRNPDPGAPGSFTVPVLGQHSYFSSKGPTRDGRTGPQIAAPGEYIFAALSSHLTEGQGYDRSDVLEGGRYVGMQGTSMATPHVTGVVALMLQANPRLDYEDVVEILRGTARVDDQTGAVPNNRFGHGRIDALAAVQRVVARYGPGTNPGGNPGGETGTTVAARNFDPAGAQRTFSLDRVFPVDSGFVAGTNLYLDRSKATLLTLPGGAQQGTVSEVKVWFGYKRSGTDARRYTLEIYNGSAATGPVGEPLFRGTYTYSTIRADADFSTPEVATVHTLPQSIRVGQTFYVAVDFGTYTPAEAGDLSIVTTDLVGQRVAGVWDRLSDGSWINTADAWNFGSGAGKDGFQLWVEAAARVQTATDVERDADVPEAFSLAQNYPNPFNPETTIAYTLTQAGPVRLTVYDVLGRTVRTLVDEHQAAGRHAVAFDARDLPSGMYLYRLETGAFSAAKTMMLVK